MPMIREVNPIAMQDERIYEVHPEVSFVALTGHHLAPKQRWNGHTERREVLVRAGIVIDNELRQAGPAATDDILDAAVAAWSARRIAIGAAVSLPQPPEHDGNGHQIAIWY